MTPSTIRTTVLALALGGLIAILVIGYRSWKSGQDAKEDLDQAQRTDQATTGIIDDITTGEEAAQQVEIIVTESRSSYQRGYEDAKRENPAIADWASQPIDQRLRDLARERRLARERSGRAGAGSESDAPAEGTRR